MGYFPKDYYSNSYFSVGYFTKLSQVVQSGLSAAKKAFMFFDIM
jgi:hypothetical protein